MKKRSQISYVIEWAGAKKKYYLASILLATLNVICRLVPYYFIADIIKLIIAGNKNIQEYTVKLVLIAALFILAEIFHGISTSYSHKATFEVLSNIRRNCFDRLAKVPLGLVKDKGIGEMKNVLVERVDSIETTLAHVVPEFTSNMLAPAVLIITLFVLDWRLALLSFIPVVVGLLLSLGMFAGYEESYKRAITATKNLNSTAVEYINGIEVIKAFGKSEKSQEKFKEDANECAYSFIDWMRACIFPMASMFVIMPYTLLTLLPFGAWFVHRGTFSLIDFIVCVILSIGVTGPLLIIAGYFDDIHKAQVIIGEVAAILELPILDRPEKTKSQPEDSSISLEDVRFAYKEKEVLHGINMQIKAGTINAFVGPSGSGKSTIAKLIASLWDVDNGNIKFGGVNIKEISLEDYNRKVAYVAQDNYLFNETVRENIRKGCPEARDEDVEEIAKKSGCYDFIMNLENGFDTVVGSAGGHLSGGERQRISIARAMLKNAPIIILDEATAYTDPENEAILQASLAKLIAGKTVIVIAHRLSTVKDSDCIFVVSEGMIEACGKHDELLNSCSLYKGMWEAHIESKDYDEGVA